MRRNFFAACTAAIALFGCSSIVHAATLFQSIPNLNVPASTSGICSPCGGNNRVFDTFTLSNNSTINSIVVGLFDGSNPLRIENIDVSVWSVRDGLPAAQLFNQTITPAQFVSVLSAPAYVSDVTLNLAGLTLGAGTYDISFYSTGDLGVAGYAGGSGLLYQQGGMGFGLGQSAGFILRGEVLSAPQGTVIANPIPAALPLFASALGALGFVDWRRKRKSASRSG